MTQNLSSNIPKLLALNFTWSFLLIQAVIVPFFFARGLTLEQVFYVFSIFSLTLCTLDVPTGYLSDVLGRKTVLVVGSAFKAAGGVVLALSHEFFGFVAAYTLIGIGNSFFSGSDSAMLFETRAALSTALSQHEQRKYENLFSRRSFYSQMGFVLAALVGGVLASVSLDLVIWANAAFAFLPLFLCLSLEEPPRPSSSKRKLGEGLSQVSIHFLFSSVRVRQLVLIGILYGAAPLIAMVLFQGNWKSQGLSLAFFGYVTAFYQLAGALSGRISHRLERHLGRRGSLLLIGALPVVGFWGGGLSLSIALVLGALLEICRGLTQSILIEALAFEAQSQVRATLSSIVSLGSRLIVAGAGPLLGWLADMRGYSMALWGLSALYFVVWLGAWLFLLKDPLARSKKVLS